MASVEWRNIMSEKKRGGKFKWIVIVIVVLVIIAAVGGSSDDDDKKVKKVGEAGNTTQSGDNNSSDGKEDGTEADTEPANEFYAGDIVETDNLRITFVSAEDYVSDNQFIQPADGKKFVKADFEFENISDKDVLVSSYDFDCYADGYDMQMSYIEDESLDATLSPGKKTKGSVVFEVSVDAAEVLIQYETDYWSEDKIDFYVSKPQ